MQPVLSMVLPIKSIDYQSDSANSGKKFEVSAGSIFSTAYVDCVNDQFKSLILLAEHY